MLTFLKDLKIQNKFIIIGSTLLLFLAISIVGMLEIAKTTYLQKREREHAVFTEVLSLRSKEYIDLLKIGSTASKNKAADLVNQRSSNYQKMGILQLLDEIKERPADVLNKDVNAIEKVIFRMFGFGELFTICEKDVEQCDQLKELIGRFEDGNVNMERYKEELINGIKFIQDGSIRFSPLLYSASTFVKKTMLTANILFGIITLVLLFIISKIIVAPILEITNAARDIAEGNLSRVVNFTSKDELGELSASFNTMAEKTAQLIRNIVSSADELNNSSSDLSNISGQMSSEINDMSGRSTTVAAAAEEMSSNMNSVAAAIEEASTNVNLVATSADEMASTIDEIAVNTEKARDITNKAVTEANAASVQIAELGREAKEIGQVTETITEISEQTNLLALNATIEAARAGEAGKGFAVVANEIKDLAKQTANATLEIKNKIKGIQTSTAGTVSGIEQITGIVTDVNAIVATIASAVEEQSAATKEIAENVSQASQGIQEVTENTAQSSTVSGEIASDISDVNQSASAMSSSSSQVTLSAEELSGLSDKLKELVGQFKV